MIKRHLIFGAFIFFSANIFAQQTPEILMPIWFEDARGNKDTIWVGADRRASFDFNPEFGEREILTPFDSVFEVRAVHRYDLTWRTSKTIVNGVEPTSCSHLSSTRIMVHAIHLPIKVSWDMRYLVPATGSYCSFNSGLMFTPDLWAFLAMDWRQARVIFCLKRIPSFFYDDLDYTEFSRVSNNNDPWLLQHEFQVRGQGLKNVRGYHLASFSSGCTSTSSRDISDADETMLLFYPNPAENTLRFGDEIWAELKNYSIYDIAGCLILQTKTIEKQEIDISALPPGSYTLQVELRNGLKRSRKLVKI
jgi:hypothetical protein